MKVRVTQDSQASVVVLSGDIDERVTEGLAEISSRVKAPVVAFDCDDVQNINSIGIRQWMLFMATFGAQRKLSFRRCPPQLVDYATMLPRLFGSGKVESLYLSFYCEPCQHSCRALVEFARLAADRAAAANRCPRCASELSTDMDLDEICTLNSR